MLVLGLIFVGLFNLFVCKVLLKVMFNNDVLILRYFLIIILLKVILIERDLSLIGVFVFLLILIVMCLLLEILSERNEYFLGVLEWVLIILFFVIIIEVFCLIVIFFLLVSLLVKYRDGEIVVCVMNSIGFRFNVVFLFMIIVYGNMNGCDEIVLLVFRVSVWLWCIWKFLFLLFLRFWMVIFIFILGIVVILSWVLLMSLSSCIV